MSAPTGRAAFLDRDGTLIEDLGYLGDAQRVRVLPGAAGAVAALRRRGYQVIVVTNQSGVGRGLLAHADVAAVHQRLDELLARDDPDAVVDAYYYCPHRPDEGGEPTCACRKPRPGLLLRAAAEHDIALADSFGVGDSARDSIAALSAGCGAVVRIGPRDAASLADAVSSLLRSPAPPHGPRIPR